MLESRVGGILAGEKSSVPRTCPRNGQSSMRPDRSTRSRSMVRSILCKDLRTHHAWYEATPEDFVFSVKGSRFLTHMKRLNLAETALANFLGFWGLAPPRKAWADLVAVASKFFLRSRAPRLYFSVLCRGQPRRRLPSGCSMTPRWPGGRGQPQNGSVLCVTRWKCAIPLSIAAIS